MTGRATTWDEETPLARTRRARRIGRILESTYPDARCELDFRDPYELLIATVLSAQTTDVRVNGVTPELFARYPDARHLAAADRADVEEIIKPTGFFRAKTTSLIGLAQALCADFDGEVPDRLERLTTLPGVGRKTANVVLGNAFGVPGITVDTHVGRLARRMRLSVETDPVKVERDLMRVFEKRSWTQLCHVLIWHGRRRCHARRPACGACPVVRLCPSAGIGPLEPAVAAKLVRTQGRG